MMLSRSFLLEALTIKVDQRELYTTYRMPVLASGSPVGNGLVRNAVLPRASGCLETRGGPLLNGIDTTHSLVTQTFAVW